MQETILNFPHKYKGSHSSVKLNISPDLEGKKNTGSVDSDLSRSKHGILHHDCQTVD